MLKINKKMEYALIALNHMKGKPDGNLSTAKEICLAYKTPFDPLSRVLQIMAQQGVLKAEQGAKGGYKIAKDLRKISMFDLTHMIEGPIQVVNCIGRRTPRCGRGETCALRAPMHRINEHLSDLFKTISVGEML